MLNETTEAIKTYVALNKNLKKENTTRYARVSIVI